MKLLSQDLNALYAVRLGGYVCANGAKCSVLDCVGEVGSVDRSEGKPTSDIKKY